MHVCISHLVKFGIALMQIKYLSVGVYTSSTTTAPCLLFDLIKVKISQQNTGFHYIHSILNGKTN